MTDEQTKVRLDKWLWATRFYKTRSSAAHAIAGGKVHVNGTRAKAGKFLALADEVRIRKGPEEFVVVVRKISEYRGKGADALELYEETAASLQTRQRLHAELKLDASSAGRSKGLGRPTKKERRELQDFKRRRGP